LVRERLRVALGSREPARFMPALRCVSQPKYLLFGRLMRRLMQIQGDCKRSIGLGGIVEIILRCTIEKAKCQQPE
jgi:hypothetical protein